MNATYAPFDPADYLDSDEVIAAYLLAARADPDPNMFLAALYDVAKARGTTKLTKQSPIRTWNSGE
jgi:probable addiction module antidote protein